MTLYVYYGYVRCEFVTELALLPFSLNPDFSSPPHPASEFSRDSLGGVRASNGRFAVPVVRVLVLLYLSPVCSTYINGVGVDSPVSTVR